MKQLLEAGVHFGHQTQRWNPKMKKYIFTSRNNVHILNLEQTTVLIDNAYAYVRDAVKAGKKVLFVGTKKQAEEAIKAEATRCGMFYVNSRWLGGTLTNFETIRSRVDRMEKLYNMEKVGEFAYLPKKEVIKLMDERDKLEANLRGIAHMTSNKDLIMVVVDSKTEHIAVGEARKLGIPVVGIIDTNCDPDDVDVIIPANDDAIRSVSLILMALADAVIEAREGITLRGTGHDDKVSMEDAINAKSMLEQSEQKDVEEEPKEPKEAKKERKEVTAVDKRGNPLKSEKK